MASETNTSSPPSPPPSHWPVAFEQLLNSSTGKDLFLDYLRNEDEGLSLPMLFLLAVEGLKVEVSEEASEEEKIVNSINVIYQQLLPSVSCLSGKVTEDIENRVSSRGVDVAIYDEAVEEVKEYLSRDLYPNFLKSDFYLAAIDQEFGGSEPVQTNFGIEETLPFQVPPTDAVAGPSTTLTSQPEVSPRFRDLLTVHENEVVASFKRPKAFQLTEDRILISQYHRAKKGTKTGQLNPYHAQYSSYNPVSRQDSEIQSISSGCTDESVGKSRTRVRTTQDNLPRLAMYNPPKREDYDKHRIAEADPAQFAAQLIQKLEVVARIPAEERIPKHKFDFEGHQLKSNQTRALKQNIFGTAIDNKALTTHLKKLEESSHVEPTRYFEEPEEVQAILDQHVRRVWKDSTTPEFSRSPRNETIVVDSRKSRKTHHTTAPPFHAAAATTSALVKGKSMQTLDSGIGGDKEYRSYKARAPAPMPRWTNKQFIDSSGVEAGRSSAWDVGFGQANLERPKSGDFPFRGLLPPSAGPALPTQHRRHSPPSGEDAVSVLVHYEFEHEKPFLIKIAKSKLTLGYLKSKVPKKGNWKYLFKLGDADDKNKLINYELKRDEEILPMFRDECVIVILKSTQPSEMSNVV